MEGIQYWQLATDSLLVLSLLFLAIRFTRSSTSHVQFRSEELQRGLRVLIKEAEEAGQLLNDRLMKRQSQLEKTLIDLESLEKRLISEEGTGKDLIGRLQSQIAEAQTIVRSFNQSIINEIPSSARSRVSEANSPVESRSATAHSNDNNERLQRWSEERQSSPRQQNEWTIEPPATQAAPEPPSFRAQPERAPTPAPKAKAPKYNIYGEPVGAAASQPLSRSVEKESDRTRPAAKAQEELSLETVYDAAEKLLRAGYDLQTVARQTSLPLDEVRMLSQMVASDSNVPNHKGENNSNSTIIEDDRSPVFNPHEVESSRTDTRLGVLGTMKRDRYTV